jgi:17 kDa common-antigen outer membrane protein
MHEHEWRTGDDGRRAAGADGPAGGFRCDGAGRGAMVVLPDGGRVPARVARSYTAANGRECREVMLGSGRGERATLVCQGGPELGGAWAVARPLLGGAVRL